MIEDTVKEGCKTLLVKNLDLKVTDKMLYDIFSLISTIDNARVIKNNNSTEDLSYGYVEFKEHQVAEQALQALNGRTVFGQTIHVMWAVQDTLSFSEMHEHRYTLLVENLGHSINESDLRKAFMPLQSPLHVHIVWNPETGKSTGSGLVAFDDKTVAEKAIVSMNGKKLGAKNIRCSWANAEKSAQNDGSETQPPTPPNNCEVTSANMSYEQIFAQTPPYNTTVYIGNLPRETTCQHIAPYLQQYGHVSDIHMHASKGYALVKLDTHANASTAIFALQGFNIGGRPVSLSWGDDKISQGAIQCGAGNEFKHYTPGHADNNAWILPSEILYNPYTMRPPAPVVGGLGNSGIGEGFGQHGWNQYYQHYYSAGHQSI
ncbi:hypothetical protein BDF14DRAFT_1784848 [Spinellus fusiger]|nr:hypothetical protein BDF14DRAFT_1784848 [Spinellus fusiger]